MPARCLRWWRVSSVEVVEIWAMRINVRAQTIRDDTHQGLIERLVGITEMLLNRGDKVIAIFPSPVEVWPVEYTATIFSSFEVDK
jgi:hypothetical protein